MSSKKEEERNEKIIRGLMKLPPNRRCINCNSVGPQYVCTNFWTFVCLSCSGIHREFTHRVKSVSMAKFTKQEVEALQQGGNQRARDIYLKNWDMTRMRLPDSSNADKIRDFIRSVYVNKKYAGERLSENSSKDSESLRANESELKRPNSYHSFSQSPPYDYQYEERRYGKNSTLAPKRLASDRGYEGKVPSFLFSPGHAREHVMFEDRFANEGSGSRRSDFSVSSAGDQFRYDTQSPNSQGGYPSPNVAYQSNRHPNARPQRTASSGSIGSLDSNSIPESNSEQQPVQLASGFQQLVTSPTSQRPPLSSNPVGTRPALIRSAASFNQPPQQIAPSAPDTSVDLFAGFNEHNMIGLNRTVSDGLVVTSPIQPTSIRPDTSLNRLPTQQPAASTPSLTSVDLFAGFNEHNTTGLNRTVSDGLAVISTIGPALVRPAGPFNQLPTQQPAASTSSVTSVDLFAGFNDQNTTGLNRTVSDGLAVISSTGPALVKPAASFNQLPMQQTTTSKPSDTSVDLFSRFNENNTTVYVEPVVTSPTEVVPASTSVDLFAGFNNQPSEVKDEGWANFDFSQQKQVVANSSIQSSPVVTSSGNDLTSGMQPLIGQIPVNNADTVPQVPQRVAKAPPVNQERFQPWNAFGESSSSGLYATNTQMQMPLPQPSGMTQVTLVANEVAQPHTPLAVQSSAQNTMTLVPAQPQSVDQWFANSLGSNVSPYQGISQSSTPYDAYSGHVGSKDLESAVPNLTNLPTNVVGTMPLPHQPLQTATVTRARHNDKLGSPYQAMQSTNPFDFLDDSDLPSNTFMDMGSIQAALPAQQPAADYYSSGTFHSEHYTQNPISTYPSHFSQGNMQQMSDQVFNAQIPNPPPQGYQSLGSNPFA